LDKLRQTWVFLGFWGRKKPTENSGFFEPFLCKYRERSDNKIIQAENQEQNSHDSRQKDFLWTRFCGHFVTVLLNRLNNFFGTDEEAHSQKNEESAKQSQEYFEKQIHVNTS